MSSSYVLVVPIIAAVIISAIIIGLAAWVAYGMWRKSRAAYQLASAEYHQMTRYAQDTDNMVCKVIEQIERSPATADTLLPSDVQRDIYQSHAQFRELRTMKGIK